MKPGIDPDYRPVVFHDTSVDEYFVVGSTLKTDRTIEWKDGKHTRTSHWMCRRLLIRFTQVSNEWFKRKGVLRTSTVVLVNLLVRRNKS